MKPLPSPLDVVLAVREADPWRPQDILPFELRAVGVGPGDQVLVPALTFAGAAAAVVHCGATPRFVDCLSKPYGVVAWFKLDRHLRSLPKDVLASVKALIAVDLFGQPC